MSFIQAGQLARSTPIALPDDSVGHLAQNLRESTFGVLPVLDRVPPERRMADQDNSPVRVLGMVLECDLTKCPENTNVPVMDAAKSTFGEDVQSAEAKSTFIASSASSCKASDLMRTELGFVPAVFSLENTLLTLQRYDVPALPVIDGNGLYLGLISQADVLAAMNKQVRPPMAGGMATPLGVWLTDGRISAGAPTLGLFLSGVLMGLCFIFSYVAMMLALYLINADWMVQFVSGRIGADSGSGSWFNMWVTLAQGILFLGAFRLLPIAGIHAAEHQTVWAMERGLELTPENVKQMPRAHPRCGTNLVALAGLIEIVFQHLPSFDPGTILVALLFIYLLWRNLGEWLQNNFTTRPATQKQLESGIKAGRELIQKYQEEPQVVTSFGRRLFNSGLIYSAVGMMLTLGIFTYGMMLLSQLVLG